MKILDEYLELFSLKPASFYFPLEVWYDATFTMQRAHVKSCSNFSQKASTSIVIFKKFSPLELINKGVSLHYCLLQQVFSLPDTCFIFQPSALSLFLNKLTYCVHLENITEFPLEYYSMTAVSAHLADLIAARQEKSLIWKAGSEIFDKELGCAYSAFISKLEDFISEYKSQLRVFAKSDYYKTKVLTALKDFKKQVKSKQKSTSCLLKIETNSAGFYLMKIPCAELYKRQHLSYLYKSSLPFQNAVSEFGLDLEICKAFTIAEGSKFCLLLCPRELAVFVENNFNLISFLKLDTCPSVEQVQLYERFFTEDEEAVFNDLAKLHGATLQMLKVF